MKITTSTGALRFGWALFIVVVMSFIVAVASIGFTIRTQDRADKRWCSLMILVDRPYINQPGLSKDEQARRKQAALELHHLRMDLGCR